MIEVTSHGNLCTAAFFMHITYRPSKTQTVTPRFTAPDP